MAKQEPNPQERPFKYVEYDSVIEFRCKLQYLDFEGRSDGKSMRNILQQLTPKKLVNLIKNHV